MRCPTSSDVSLRLHALRRTRGVRDGTIGPRPRNGDVGSDECGKTVNPRTRRSHRHGDAAPRGAPCSFGQRPQSSGVDVRDEAEVPRELPVLRCAPARKSASSEFRRASDPHACSSSPSDATPLQARNSSGDFMSSTAIAREWVPSAPAVRRCNRSPRRPRPSPKRPARSSPRVLRARVRHNRRSPHLERLRVAQLQW